MTPRQAEKILKTAGFATVKRFKKGTLYRLGAVSMVVPHASDLRARTENDIRRAIHQVEAAASATPR